MPHRDEEGSKKSRKTDPDVKAEDSTKNHPEQPPAEQPEKPSLNKEPGEERRAEIESGAGGEKMPDKEVKEEETETEEIAFPVIGIGASAGGLEAIETFLAHVPAESGMAFVVVTHTDPDRVTLLPDILRRDSQITVRLIKEGMEVEPDTLYLPPSNKELTLENRRFHLKERHRKDGLFMPIDFFFKSLAEDCRVKAAGVILSGTGSDGTEGIRSIKEQAGVAVCQEPDSARYAGMPQNAIDTGLVDFILAPEKMAEELHRYFLHFGKIKPKRDAEKSPYEVLQKILSFLANRTKHDFSQYKKKTLIRRIERRMSIIGVHNGSEYLDYLRRNPSEVTILFDDLLIGVTSFFRDPEAFSFLQKNLLPDLINETGRETPIRIWIPGCSTGEEAYSVAIIVHEAMRKEKVHRRLQVFATDVDQKAIEKARHGVYLENIAADVSTDRLRRFFTKEGNQYRITQDLRDSIVFAVQDVLSDPPFSNIDLLVCRNLMIYLEPGTQQRLIPLFHYTLSKGGILFLGLSESIGRFGELFEVKSKKFSIYRKRETKGGYEAPIQFPARHPRLIPDFAAELKVPGISAESPGIAQATEKFLLKNHTPACVVVDRDGHILYVHGRTGKYLEQPSGRPSLEIVEMAREGLRFALASALRHANSTGAGVLRERLQVATNGDVLELNLRVEPLAEPPVLKGSLVVIFEDLGYVSAKKAGEGGEESTEEQTDRVLELERELARVRQEYQGSLEELETTNEELRSSNEEIHSSNEELQSTNEELESSREELQSLNEELSTVNSELNQRMEELNEAYGSIKQVLDSTHFAVLFLDNRLRVKRFTSETAQLLNLIDSDVNRPIDHISHNLEYDQFTEKVREVLKTLVSFEDDVRTRDGRWYRMRIMPYRPKENSIEGVVTTFVNIDVQKKGQAEIERMKARELQIQISLTDHIIDTIRESLLVLDENFDVLKANLRFYETFNFDPKETEGRNLFELGGGEWETKKLRTLLKSVVAEGKSFDDYLIEHRFETIGLRRMLLNARAFREDESTGKKILLAIEDVTDRWKQRGRKTNKQKERK